MKKFWKALGIAALAAAVPVRVKRDEITGKKKYQSLLLSVDVGPGEDGEGTDIGVNLGEGVITGAISNLVDAKKEADLFADDEPEAAILDTAELHVVGDEAQDQTAADEASEEAESNTDPEYYALTGDRYEKIFPGVQRVYQQGQRPGSCRGRDHRRGLLHHHHLADKRRHYAAGVHLPGRC